MRSRSNVNHRITSGSLTMSPRFFAKESLKNGSLLRTLLGMDGGYSKKVTNLQKVDGQILLTYTMDDIVFVPDDVKGFARQLKETYGQNLKGKITISMSYGQVTFIDVVVDL